MKFAKQILAVLTGIFLLAGCSTQKPFEMEQIDLAQLETMMDEQQSFVLLVERDECPFCDAMNTYIESSKKEHPDLQVYVLDSTNYEFYREEEGDMTLISQSEEGTAFLQRFPYFLYTPAFYAIVDGVPVQAGIGYDEMNNTVSLWDVDSTIDWNTSVPQDVWEFIAEWQPDLAAAAGSSAQNAAGEGQDSESEQTDEGTDQQAASDEETAPEAEADPEQQA